MPVPPPRPVTITTTPAPAQSLRNPSASSSAAARPISGSPPAPRPRVSSDPSGTTHSTDKSTSDWMSVFSAAKRTPGKPLWEMCSTALHPAPPTPKTFRAKSPFKGFLLEMVSFCFFMAYFFTARNNWLTLFLMPPRLPWPVRFFDWNEPNFTRPIAVANSGWSSADFSPLMEFVLPSDTGRPGRSRGSGRTGCARRSRRSAGGDGDQRRALGTLSLGVQG